MIRTHFQTASLGIRPQCFTCLFQLKVTEIVGSLHPACFSRLHTAGKSWLEECECQFFGFGYGPKSLRNCRI